VDSVSNIQRIGLLAVFVATHVFHDILFLHLNMSSGRPSFASKTTFDSLDVDSGEETEEEEVPEPPSARPVVTKRVVSRDDELCAAAWL
jgi:hypothetical protein